MRGYAIDPTLPPGLPKDGRKAVVTIGTFDGVHLGHWAVLTEIRRRAEAVGGRSVLVTFHPHPLTIVRPESAPPMLTTPVEKKEILAESGLDYAVFLTFTPILAAYSPRRFVEEILVDRVNVGELVVGYDHHFGKGREGNVDMLKVLGRELGFAVDVVGPVGSQGDAISSHENSQCPPGGGRGDRTKGFGPALLPSWAGGTWRPTGPDAGLSHGESRSPGWGRRG